MQIVAAGVTARTSANSQTSQTQTSQGAKRFNGDSHLDGESRSPHVFRETAREPASHGCCEKQERYQRVLRETGIGELRKVRVEVTDGKVQLHGRVSTFYAKQLAQEALRPYAIGLKIDNRLSVDLP